MPIRFACEHCGQKLSVSPEKAGVRAKCPKCLKPVTVPKEDTLPAPTSPKGTPAAALKPVPAVASAAVEKTADQKIDTLASPSIPTPASVSTIATQDAVVPTAATESKAPSAEENQSIPPESPQPPPPPQPPTMPLEEPDLVFPEINTDVQYELIYERDDAVVAAQVDLTKLAVARWVIYTQGALLGLVGILGFFLGFLAGGSGEGMARKAGPKEPQPTWVTGNVMYTVKSGEKFPDDGAVVLIVPQNEKPNIDEKIRYEGLRPSDPFVGDTHEGFSLIRSLGGGHSRTDSKGEFRIRLPDAGKYYILILSGHAKRSDSAILSRSDLAQMGHYFLAATDLIGDRRYRWVAEDIFRDKRLKFVMD